MLSVSVCINESMEFLKSSYVSTNSLNKIDWNSEMLLWEKYIDWSPKFEAGLNIVIGVVQKV